MLMPTELRELMTGDQQILHHAPRLHRLQLPHQLQLPRQPALTPSVRTLSLGHWKWCGPTRWPAVTFQRRGRPTCMMRREHCWILAHTPAPTACRGRRCNGTIQAEHGARW